MGNIMDEIADVLRGLADQLGTSVEYLWPLLVKQTQIDYVGMLLFLVVVTLVAAYIDKKSRRPDDWFEEYEINPSYYIGFIARILSIFLFVRALLHVAHISQFIVPEAATIERLLDMIK